MIGAVVLAVAATGVGYAAMSKTVTLSIDGKTQEVHTFGDDVGDVLKSEDISLGDHDVVAPGTTSSIADGATIAVKYGRPLDVKVDGKTNRYWVTATDVDTALDQLGLRFGGADLSASRGASIGRSGMDLAVVTPKSVVVKLGDAKSKKTTVTALTVGEALKELGTPADSNDRVKPGLGAVISDGDKLTLTKVRVVQKRVAESIGYGRVKKQDASMYTDESETVRAGRPGSRKVLYKVTFENGKVAARKAVRSTVLREPVNAIVKVGTKERPAPCALDQLRRREQRLGPDRRVRVRRQLGREHRQRLLRRPAVQPRDLAVLRRLRPAGPAEPRGADRRRRAGPCRRGRLRRLAGVRTARLISTDRVALVMCE